MHKEKAIAGDGSPRPSGDWDGQVAGCEKVKCAHKSKVNHGPLRSHGSSLPSPVTRSTLKTAGNPRDPGGQARLRPACSLPNQPPTHSCGGKSEFKTLRLPLSYPQFESSQEPFQQRKAAQHT